MFKRGLSVFTAIYVAFSPMLSRADDGESGARMMNERQLRELNGQSGTGSPFKIDSNAAAARVKGTSNGANHTGGDPEGSKDDKGGCLGTGITSNEKDFFKATQDTATKLLAHKMAKGDVALANQMIASGMLSVQSGVANNLFVEQIQELFNSYQNGQISLNEYQEKATILMEQRAGEEVPGNLEQEAKARLAYKVLLKQMMATIEAKLNKGVMEEMTMKGVHGQLAGKPFNINDPENKHLKNAFLDMPLIQGEGGAISIRKAAETVSESDPEALRKASPDERAGIFAQMAVEQMASLRMESMKVWAENGIKYDFETSQWDTRDFDPKKLVSGTPESKKLFATMVDPSSPFNENGEILMQTPDGKVGPGDLIQQIARGSKPAPKPEEDTGFVPVEEGITFGNTTFQWKGGDFRKRDSAEFGKAINEDMTTYYSKMEEAAGKRREANDVWFNWFGEKDALNNQAAQADSAMGNVISTMKEYGAPRDVTGQMLQASSNRNKRETMEAWQAVAKRQGAIDIALAIDPSGAAGKLAGLYGVKDPDINKMNWTNTAITAASFGIGPLLRGVQAFRAAGPLAEAAVAAERMTMWEARIMKLQKAAQASARAAGFGGKSATAFSRGVEAAALVPRGSTIPEAFVSIDRARRRASLARMSLARMALFGGGVPLAFTAGSGIFEARNRAKYQGGSAWCHYVSFLKDAAPGTLAMSTVFAALPVGTQMLSRLGGRFAAGGVTAQVERMRTLYKTSHALTGFYFLGDTLKNAGVGWYDWAGKNAELNELKRQQAEGRKVDKDRLHELEEAKASAFNHATESTLMSGWMSLGYLGSAWKSPANEPAHFKAMREELGKNFAEMYKGLAEANKDAGPPVLTLNGKPVRGADGKPIPLGMLGTGKDGAPVIEPNFQPELPVKGDRINSSSDLASAMTKKMANGREGTRTIEQIAKDKAEVEARKAGQKVPTVDVATKTPELPHLMESVVRKIEAQAKESGQPVDHILRVVERLDPKLFEATEVETRNIDPAKLKEFDEMHRQLNPEDLAFFDEMDAMTARQQNKLRKQAEREATNGKGEDKIAGLKKKELLEKYDNYSKLKTEASKTKSFQIAEALRKIHEFAGNDFEYNKVASQLSELSVDGLRGYNEVLSEAISLRKELKNPTLGQKMNPLSTYSKYKRLLKEHNGNEKTALTELALNSLSWKAKWSAKDIDDILKCLRFWMA